MALILGNRSSLLVVNGRKRHILAPVRVAAGPSPLDILAGSQRLKILEHADQELKELCTSLDTEDERQKCFEVYDYYHENRSKALSGCAQELEKDGKAGTACQSLDNLERLVYEVAFTGDAETLYRTLKVQSNIAKRAESGASSPQSDTLQRISAHSAEELKTKAMQLFEDMDADGNGVIDREEFLNAMHMLHHALSDHEMELVFSCMDAHGYLTPEQFVNIVQAERLSDPSADAEVLRHTKHARPSWWTDAPHCVTDV
eukprot:GHUV01003032.1.p1 GENE.GHUV01003032.1~~GHUV01003032.1.p1  ORF type:complete len:259 (+),score=38.06 GHUV01003032.1:117-893(+)